MARVRTINARTTSTVDLDLMKRVLERGNSQAAVVFYDDLNPLLLRFNPMGYQETSFAKLSGWLADQSPATPGQFSFAGPTKIIRHTNADHYRVLTICPTESRIIPVGFALGDVWKPFIDRYDTETGLTWMRVKLPPTLWMVNFRWTRSGVPSFDLHGTQIYAVTRTRYRHYGIGNVGTDGSVCWGPRMAGITGVPSLNQVRDLFYGSPFNTDLQARKFYWSDHGLPMCLHYHLRRSPAITEIPARCFTGRGFRRMGVPGQWSNEQTGV